MGTQEGRRCGGEIRGEEVWWGDKRWGGDTRGEEVWWGDKRGGGVVGK